jgi:hypothetical protein
LAKETLLPIFKRNSSMAQYFLMEEHELAQVELPRLLGLAPGPHSHPAAIAQRPGGRLGKKAAASTAVQSPI